ncbi:magnesium transporter [Novosphingobium sp. FSY-8]|uniref:Magnesium transporter n=1 Tax=Novosphingobium ovatum TaxID=1908523 RepID=A0ABW9XCY2_9SPHN|nr:magnesium transporter CorA family protein [Novosphingobium ovatum]NBC36380.1 magnesium transporter [Novosphingobium ovatum]
MTRDQLVAGADPVSAAWIDLCDPSPAECAQIEADYGITLPSADALREIETSSRLRAVGDTLVMTAPLLTRDPAFPATEERWMIVPTGFILTPRVLVTIHYAPLAPLTSVAQAIGPTHSDSPAGLLLHVLEEVIDRAADQLEMVSEQISAISRRIFYGEIERQGLQRETALLRRAIMRLGRAYDRSARVRFMFLSIGRMAGFLAQRGKDRLDAGLEARLHTIINDITSLDEFEASLSARIQFLQDAATSLVNIEQNDVVKVLTVASVAGIPPVLVVGIYGMNFQHMPELSWQMGYPMALALCLITTLVPFVWFKWRKWL